ncbi:hypothetical protein A3A93_02960 [Candidatus Roizmanbacteria bacterium RIFCSPLOWO2_01_FULL_38_12]|uniref:Uncharacterized protein n=1 Tax=Candidatus Roizmanbacteria bacterium RIFCSPLOWO2_01_FULL_38_12 TaxID=1802061 RepID=A0A1F7IWD0_9BACT|nr:MAG: hypothetical protein A3F59_05295 [Candidatus Roizmanbacteria bacterium RIFCSPHIGHO2_12_FULL_38_13]OGK47625.1 MAG: hypothetical protein A3A93_02960 [Candidatus Roizmanbacteria bacterium RIFCSPLOWO2_01_FULL_38_12]
MPFILLTFLVIELSLLFYISRQSINSLYFSLRSIVQNDKVVYSIIAFLFFPGTIIHELSHFLIAILLLHKVRAIHIFPVFEKNHIRLGRVIYEKKDALRSILVGIAPVIVGIMIFWWISTLDIFFIQNLWLKTLIIYLIFIVSTTMFLSKADLIDFGYVLPIGVVLVVGFLNNSQLIAMLSDFVYDVNVYLGISIIIHTILLVVFFTFKKITTH